MKIEQLIELTENRLKHIQNMLQIYTQQGDVDNVLKYQQLVDETENTLEKLKSLV